MKKAIALVLSLLLVLSLAACAAKAPAEQTEQPAAADAAAETTGTPAAEETNAEETDAAETTAKFAPDDIRNQPLKIAWCCLNMSNTYHATVAHYFELEAQKRGIDYMILDDKSDATTGMENLQLAIDSGCNVYASVMGYAIRDAQSEISKEAGILAVGIDQAIPDFPYFGAENVKAGKICADGIAQAAFEKWGDDVEIDLFISLEASEGDPVNDTRMRDGMQAGLREYFPYLDDVTVHCNLLAISAEEAMRYVQDTIAAHPEAEHILIGGFVDDDGQGAEAAVEKLGIKDKVVIGTIDGSVLFLNNCLNKDTAWVCATAMTPEMYGYYFLDTLCKYWDGEIDELPDEWYVQHQLITTDNYEEVLTSLIDYDEYQITYE